MTLFPKYGELLFVAKIVIFIAANLHNGISNYIKLLL